MGDLGHLRGFICLDMQRMSDQTLPAKRYVLDKMCHQTLPLQFDSSPILEYCETVLTKGSQFT